jgi:hypothetical protein
MTTTTTSATRQFNSEPVGYYGDRLWASLRVNPYTLLDPTFVDSALAKRPGAVLCLNVQRTYTETGANALLGGLVLPAGAVDSLTTDTVELLQLQISVRNEALVANQMRSVGLYRSDRFGLRLPTRKGKQDDARPHFVNRNRSSQAQRELDRVLKLLGALTPKPEHLYEKLMYNNLTNLCMLFDELSVREQLKEQRDGPRRASPPPADNSSEELDWSRVKDSEDDGDDDQSSETSVSCVTLGSESTETERESMSDYVATDIIVGEDASSSQADSDDDDESTSDSGLSAMSVMSTSSDESGDVDIEFREPRLRNVVPPAEHTVDELQWLRAALASKQASIKFVSLHRVPRATLLERSRRVCAPLLVDNELTCHAQVDSVVDEQDGDEDDSPPAFLVTTLAWLSGKLKQSKPAVADADVDRAPTPAQAVPVQLARPVAVVRTEQWLDDLAGLKLDELTVYEVTKYAETRLAVHAALFYEHACSEFAERGQLLQPPANTTHQYWLAQYPRRTKANYAVLRTLGAAKRSRYHEAIALMALCCASQRGQKECCEFLLLCEALLVAHRHNNRRQQQRSGVLADNDYYDTDDDDDDEQDLRTAIRLRCKTIEQMWERMRMDKAGELVQSMFDNIHDEWNSMFGDLQAQWDADDSE